MTLKIPTTYKDQFGSVNTEIMNDFETLTITIEGTKFEGQNFDDFTPVDFENIPSRFKLNHLGVLNDCTLFCRIPLIVNKNERDVPSTLLVDIHLDANENEYHTYSFFSLVLENRKIEIGKTQHFESAFEILKNKFPTNTYIKCCFNCLYADYSYAGSAIFGTMFCFKNIKEKYLAVQSKDEYIDIFELHEGRVQEIYLSESFERRVKGTGYRG